jgi:hypothetical protein
LSGVLERSSARETSALRRSALVPSRGGAGSRFSAFLPGNQRLVARFLAAGFLAAGAFFFAAVVLVFAAALAMVVFPFSLSLQSESIFELRTSCGIETILLIKKRDFDSSSAVFHVLCCDKSTKK